MASAGGAGGSATVTATSTGSNATSVSSSTGAAGGNSGLGGDGGATSTSAGTSTAGAGGSGGGTQRPQRVLLYSFSTLDIPSVPAQLAIYKQKLESWQYEVDESEDPAVFSEEGLANYAAVGMINTCFAPFGEGRPGNGPEAEALQSLLQEGGGLFGIHCADVAFQSDDPAPLYSQLLGGRASSDYFDGESECHKLNEHATVSLLPETFVYNGNLDATDFIAADTTVLVNCTWSTGRSTPVSWMRNEGPGRVFFTSFGKVDADLTNPTIGDNHIIAGLAWVVGH